MLLLQGLSTPGIHHTTASCYLIFFILFISAVSSATSSQPRTLTLDDTAFPKSLSRRQACNISSSSRCAAPAQAFCCPASAECISINNGTSVICCPAGEDCSFIQPVECQSTFATCGAKGQCCPVGYECDSNHSDPTSIGCRLKDENLPESYRLKDECAKLNGSGYSSDSCNALIEATKATCLQGCDQFPVKAIATGFFPGMAVGATVMLFIGLYMRKREMKALKKSRSWRTEKGVGQFSSGKESRSTGAYKELGMPTPPAPIRITHRSSPRTSRRATTYGMRPEIVSAYIPRRHRSAAERTGHGHVHVQRPARSVDALSSTEIAIGYDRKQDEQFLLRSGHIIPAGDTRLTSPTPTFPQRASTPLDRSATRASRTTLKGMSVLWRNDLKGSSNSSRVKRSPDVAAEVIPPSASGAVTAAATTEQAADPHRMTPTTTSPSPSTQQSSGSPLPSPSLAEMNPPIVGTAATAAQPLTHEHLLQHQQLQSRMTSTTPADARNPQSSHRSTSMPSSLSTSLYLSDDDPGPSDRRRSHLSPHGHFRSPFHRDRRRRKSKHSLPPSDVTSCITDGEYE